MLPKFKNIIFIPAIVGAFLIGLSFTFLTKTNTTKGSLSSQVISARTEASSSANVEQLSTLKVIRVIDGDTIEIEGNKKVRLIGIDTPETVDPNRPLGCFGQEASSETNKLLENKSVTLEKDVSETDKYGRLLRYVFIDGLFINDYLVRLGYAQVSTYPPDVKYQNQFLEAQKEARDNQRGLWSKCQNPQQQPVMISTESHQNDCIIKGNISSTGEKIYHIPDQRYYEKTQIDETKGEHWFCTENEAITAGWRKSKV